MEIVERSAAPGESVGERQAPGFPPGAAPLTIFCDNTGSEDEDDLLTSASLFGMAEQKKIVDPALTLLPLSLLVVEDNDDLRQIMEMFLDMMGFAVTGCSDAATASEIFRSRGDIDLLITDLQMPGRSGMELARELTAFCPSLPVMIVSGSILSSECLREIHDRNWKFIPKPYGFPAMLAGIQHLLLPHRPMAA